MADQTVVPLSYNGELGPECGLRTKSGYECGLIPSSVKSQTDETIDVVAFLWSFLANSHPDILADALLSAGSKHTRTSWSCAP